jgi:hypothetical protein
MNLRQLSLDSGLSFPPSIALEFFKFFIRRAEKFAADERYNPQIFTQIIRI